MKTITILLLSIFTISVLSGQEEVKLKFSGIDKMVIKRNTNGDLQLVYPNNASDNIFIGSDVGNSNKGAKNVGLGQFALSGNITGFSNTAVGFRTGEVNTIGSKNVFVGADAGLLNTGHENVFLGHRSGENNEGSGNIFIGSGAGADESGSNKLIIDNGFTAVPFIEGQMGSRILSIDGKINIANSLTAENITLNGNVPALTLRSAGSASASWIVNTDNENLRFKFSDIGASPTPILRLHKFGKMLVDGTVEVKDQLTINTSSGISSLRYNNINDSEDYEVLSTTLGYFIRGGVNGIGTQLPLRISLNNLNETFLHDNVIIENDLKISNTFESKILFERTTSGGHDWEVLAKSGDLFFRGGADGSSNDLFNKVIMRNDGDLEVCGKISATSAVINTISCSSDFRFKKNILPLKSVLSNVLLLQGVSYEWNQEDFPDKGFNDEPQLGFIAQDVEVLFPEVVKTDEEGYKSIDYARLTPLLVESIKEQQLKIEEQQQSITDMKSMLELLATKVEVLEKKAPTN